MLDTWTRLQKAIPASLRASSKLASLSLCLPTPLVKKIMLGTNIPMKEVFESEYLEFVRLLLV